MTTIYRPIHRSTASRQPGDSSWHTEVLWYGTDRGQALVAHYQHQSRDRFNRYGHTATETFIEQNEVGAIDLVEVPSEMWLANP